MGALSRFRVFMGLTSTIQAVMGMPYSNSEGPAEVLVA